MTLATATKYEPSLIPERASLALAGQGTAGQVELEDRCRPQRILVVDEQELIQAGLRAVLSREVWVEGCLGAGSVEAAWAAALRHQPQLILLSTTVSGTSGLELCRAFRERLPCVKVVLMSGDGRVAAALAMANGAVGFVPKQTPVAGIVQALRRVAEGSRVFPTAPHATEASVQLSRREHDVLQLLVGGLSNPEIALRLHLSRHTVKQHTSVVYRKLGVRNRAQAASRAQELGLVA